MGARRSIRARVWSTQSCRSRAIRSLTSASASWCWVRRSTRTITPQTAPITIHDRLVDATATAFLPPDPGAIRQRRLLGGPKQGARAGACRRSGYQPGDQDGRKGPGAGQALTGGPGLADPAVDQDDGSRHPDLDDDKGRPHRPRPAAAVQREILDRGDGTRSGHQEGQGPVVDTVKVGEGHNRQPDPSGPAEGGHPHQYGAFHPRTMPHRVASGLDTRRAVTTSLGCGDGDVPPGSSDLRHRSGAGTEKPKTRAAGRWRR